MSTLDKAALIEQAAVPIFRDIVRCQGYDPDSPEEMSDWSESDLSYMQTDSRTHATLALPVIAKALLAPLRELHKPVNLIFSWNSGVRSEDPCETCGVKAGVHPCGCWGDYDLPVYCEACSAASEFKRSVAHPCPTVLLIDAIEGELQ